MATKKTEKTNTTKKVEKAVKETTSKIKTAVKSAVKTVAKKAKTAAEKPAKAVKAVEETVKSAAKASVKSAVKPAAKAAKAPAKAVAKSAPKASEQNDVKVKVTAKPVAKKVAAVRKLAEKATAVKAAAKPVTKTASMAQTFDPEYLVLMQKDPNWMQAFWDVSEDRIKKAKKGKGKLVLRLFDVLGDLTVKRAKKRKFHDVEVPADARSWYVENKATDNTVAVLGFADGKNFMPLVESAPVQAYTPNGSEVNVDDVFVRASLGGAAMGGFGSSGLSSMSAKNWLESLSSSSGSMFSGALSSAALKSNKLELPKDSVNYGKDFFLWVKTRLIVYGGTRPDAHLQVRGEPFPLNPDGTFSFEEDLPDSTKIIPVFATDKDGDFPTTIVPIVVKRTE
ncbi:MAG: DUF4912 domain-containing protein [Fibrobacter sp.]|uniref:DUF4912 domain-containing protein n=1 Tax=Fibrobacter sp. TaxID=35828 RepID=UPI0025C1E698|nr:DUF4912 domain-containing protein [Fibrobacter sp.]MBR4784527.1 DUF4912 domain-containing protein [Fibrobacter sp.]